MSMTILDAIEKVSEDLKNTNESSFGSMGVVRIVGKMQVDYSGQDLNPRQLKSLRDLEKDARDEEIELFVDPSGSIRRS